MASRLSRKPISTEAAASRLAVCHHQRVDDAGQARWRAVVGGDLEPSWNLLATTLLGSGSLTEAGQQTSRWAMDQIAAFLGEPWLRRSFRDGSPVMSLLWTPLNDAPHTHLRRIELAARLALLRETPGWRDLRKLARGRTAAWEPLLLQLEAGGLALRHGWGVEFEPHLPSGKRGDLLLRGPTVMQVETTSVGLPRDMREVSRFSDRALWALQMVGVRHEIAVTGSLAKGVPDAQFNDWMAEVDAAAEEIAGTGRRRRIAAPGAGEVELIDGPLAEGERVSLNGPVVTGDEWVRLASRIEDKGGQGASALPLWIRIDEGLSLWGLTEPASWPRPEMHAALAANIGQAIASLRPVAGVVVSGALGFGVPGGSVGSWELLDGRALGLIAHVRQNLHREAVFVAGVHDAAPEQLAAWRDWYMNESSWLDWALHHLGHPKTSDLVAGNAPIRQKHCGALR